MVFGILVILPYAIIASIVLLAFLAPITEYWRMPISKDFYGTLGNLCHQLPSRSYFICGTNCGICARCLLLYLFLFIGGTYVLLTGKRISFLLFLFFILPCTIDGGTQYLGLRLSNNTLRFITGALAGLGFALYLYPLYINLIKKKIRICSNA